MSRIRARMAIATVMVTLLSVATVAPVAAAEPAWAWVVARTPTVLSYTPAAMDQGNAFGATNSVVRDALGRYTVTFGNMGGFGNAGHVQVSTLGAQPRFCAVYNWVPNGANVEVSIRCHASDGVPADSKMVVVFQYNEFIAGKAAYFWAEQPTAPGYEPVAAYNYNSTDGSTNFVTRQAVGRYFVRLGGLGSARGSFQISAHGAVNACRALDWYKDEADSSEIIIVRCRDDVGNPVDSVFNLTFMQGQGLKGAIGIRSAYLWAERPTNASYHPVAAYRWSSTGGVPTITRSAVGVYSVELPGMPRGGAALVTPTGGGRARCIVGSIRTDALPQRIVVRCFNVAGAPADAKFTLAYLK